MLKDDLSLDELFEVSEWKLAEHCRDKFADAQVLDEALADQPLLSRGDLCGLFDVGESTLSGWIRQGRMPQAAKLSYVLLSALLKIREEVSRLREEAADRKIVRDGDRFLVCDFKKDENGETIGRVVQSVGSIESARELATLPKLLRLLDHSEWFSDYVIEMSSVGDAAKSARRYWTDVEDMTAYLTDFESWRTRMRERSEAAQVDPLAVFGVAPEQTAAQRNETRQPESPNDGGNAP